MPNRQTERKWIMNLQTLCKKMNYSPEIRKILFETGYENSLKTFPGLPDFMTPHFQETYYPLIQSKWNLLPAIRRVCRITAENPEAQILAWHLHQAFLHTGNVHGLSSLTLPVSMFGDDAGIFFLMIAVSAIPMIEKTAHRLGLPSRFAKESATWIGGTIPAFAEAHNGLPGHDIRQTSWLKLTIDGELFRIGRLEFRPIPLPSYAPAIYRNKTGGIIALCPDRWTLNKEGFRVSHDSPHAVLQTTLNHCGGKITGTPISPFGHALIKKQLSLDDTLWTPVVSPWDTVLEIHIPGGGGMTPDKVRRSLMDAVELFRQHFHKEIPLFICASWILNPEWETRLPNSNIVSFQREGYLFPLEIGSGTDGLFFLFGREDGNPLSYPVRNSAQRAMQNVLREGGTLKSGGMFLSVADLKDFGTQVYRTRSSVISSK